MYDATIIALQSKDIINTLTNESRCFTLKKGGVISLADLSGEFSMLLHKGKAGIRADDSVRQLATFSAPMVFGCTGLSPVTADNRYLIRANTDLRVELVPYAELRDAGHNLHIKTSLNNLARYELAVLSLTQE